MLKGIKKLVSKDGSINWIIPYKNSKLECRYVRRNKDYISAYVSSHNGCTMGCQFCWLTKTQQTDFSHTRLPDYELQLKTILENIKEYDKDEEKKNIRVNINFMARGEALANRDVVNRYGQLYELYDEMVKNHLYGGHKMNISTIMPKTIREKTLYSIFGDYPVNLCYSLYSVNDKFRKKWIPNAMDCHMALEKLKEFQEKTHNPITFHWAFIEGENDNTDEVQVIANTIKKMKFTKTKFNLVRYNPDKNSNYQEPSEKKLSELFGIINKAMTNNVPTQQSRIITRVGYDVYASCGMFVE